MEPTLEAGQTFAAQRGRAIVAEGLSRQDANEIAVSALQNMTEEVMAEAEKEAAAAGQTLEVRTGNKFLHQFQPYYFEVAFPFCFKWFKYATACPDAANTTKQQSWPRPLVHRHFPLKTFFLLPHALSLLKPGALSLLG